MSNSDLSRDRPDYPVPSAPTTCAPGQVPEVVRRHRRFGELDPATDARPRGQRGRITAWCVACGTLLEVQGEETGEVLFSGFPHGRADSRPARSLPAPDVVPHLASATSAYRGVVADVLSLITAAITEAPDVMEPYLEVQDHLRILADEREMGSLPAVLRCCAVLLGEALAPIDDPEAGT